VSFSKASDLLTLALLAARRTGVTLAEIEATFGCAYRTAQRMTAALEVCFPGVEHFDDEEGRRHWTLPARAIAPFLSPSAEELAALSTAIRQLGDAGLTLEANALHQLDRKVRALLPPGSEARLAVDEEALLEALGHAARPGPRPAANAEVDRAISAALKGPFHLRILYRSRDEAEPRPRVVAPHGLLLGVRRYLVAVDTARDDGQLRHYRVDDISAAEVLESSFALQADFRIGEHAQAGFASFQNESELSEVVWRFAPQAAAHARRFLFHPTQLAEDGEDGSLVVRFRASGLLEMCWHLYAWGDTVEVLAPPALAALVEGYRRSDFPALP